MTGPRALMLTGEALSVADVEAVARRGRRVELDSEARRAVAANRNTLEPLARGEEAIYGVNTGFGSLSRQRIAPAGIREVQQNLIRSHAAGVGEALPDEIVRAMLLLLAGSLARAHSGVRPEVIDAILALLNHAITPIVPSRGSVGASGDLAPLAHAALVLTGEGQATIISKGNRGTEDLQTTLAGGEALEHAGLTPIVLEAKEGLAIINGTHLMAAIGALMLADVERIRQAALCAAAMAIDACRGSDQPLDERIHSLRNHPGQQRIAAVLRAMLDGSQIMPSHEVDDPRVQDPYCLRAAPQVLGAAFDAIEFTQAVIERELGAVTDNPLVFTDHARPELGAPPELILSGANFHGMNLALALDVLPIALSHIAGIAERRVNWLLAASDSENPVNIYLSPQPGLHSGLMIAQYTAAACCNEIQTLCHPASIANIPTSAGMEDYNSMGVTSAHKARAAVDLTRNVIAIELLVMAEAMEYQRPLRSGAGVERIYQTVRSAVQRLTEDRPPAPDIAAVARLIGAGAFIAKV